MCLIRICAGAAVLIVAACGGGGGGDTQGITAGDPPPPAVVVPGSRPVLVIVGGGAVPALAAGSGSEVVRDGTGLVDPGEIFVMLRDPLAGSVALDLPAPGGSAPSPLARLNAYRASAGGSALDAVTASASLATAAIRHAGWQAVDDHLRATASLNHGEPRINALSLRDGDGTPILVDPETGDRVLAGGVPAGDDLGIRIRTAWGGAFPGSDVPLARVYYEDIASDHGEPAIDQLWNTVYHRLPMMRHRARLAGYGDMALARGRFPASGIPADDPWGNPGGNGYATIAWVEYATPVIQVSHWPADGQAGVPGAFHTDTESPDPASRAVGFSGERDAVGPVLHLILPTAAAFTGIRVVVSGDAEPAWSITATTASEVFTSGPHRFSVGP
ncbi:MAG: hypothetical protein RLZZ127_703 [Planctomycetota bacterium]